MANTSLSLGEYWEKFIKQEIKSGRYGSASEVVRDALRHLEEKQSKLQRLKAHLAIGSQQVANREFVEQTPEAIVEEFKQQRGQ